MDKIDTSPEAVAEWVHLLRKETLASVSVQNRAGAFVEALAADRDRLAADNAKLRGALETLVEERRRDDRCDPDYTFTDEAREQAWNAARAALSKAQ